MSLLEVQSVNRTSQTGHCVKVSIPQVQREKVQISEDYWVETAEFGEAIEKYRRDWEELVDQAQETNVFYEPWFIENAQKYRVSTDNIQMVFVYQRGKSQQDKPRLCGAFPVMIRQWSKWFPWIKYLTLCDHPYSFLNLPHLRKGHAVDALQSLFEWIAKVHPEVNWIEFPTINADGILGQMLVQLLLERPYVIYCNELYNRGLLIRDNSSTEYLQKAMSSKRLNETRRKQRRLQELGNYEFRESQASDDINQWIENFLNMEQQGWKGTCGTAMAQVTGHAEFNREVMRQAAARNQLRFSGIFLDSQPLALKCDFVSGKGLFSYKITYDETHGKYSPGLILELETIERFHQQDKYDWVDCCTGMKNCMFENLWKDRRTVQHLTMATTNWLGHLMITGLQAMKAFSRFRKRSKPYPFEKHNF